MLIGQPQARILLSQAGLSFRTVSGGGIPLSQKIGVLNQGSGVMDWTARATTIEGGDWLEIDRASGTVNRPLLDVSFLDVKIRTAELSPGEYFGRVEVLSPSANSPSYVTVALSVLPPGSNPGPDVRPTGLVFISNLDGIVPSQDVDVVNPAATPASYASSPLTFNGRPWLSFTPPTGTIYPDQPRRLIVSPGATGLDPGPNRGVITLQFEDGTVRTVNILNVVVPAGATEAGKERPLGACPSKTLRVEHTSVREGFLAVIGQPTAVEVKVVDDCGTPFTPQTSGGGKVWLKFSNNDPVVELGHFGNGTWSGTWTPRSPGLVTVAATAGYSDANIPRVFDAPRSGNVQLGGRVPLVRPGSLRHSATFETDVPVAPGQLVTILGSNLADEAQNVATLPLPIELNRTEVLLGGQPLRLLYASDGQINAQVPYDLSFNTAHQLLVRRGPTLSVAEPFVVAQAQPGIFTRNEKGFGQAAVFTADGVRAEPGSPAKEGDEVVIYCTGLGAILFT